MGIKFETLNEIVVKAEEKQDGIFSHKGHSYAVKNKIVNYISVGVDIHMRAGNFLTKIGSVRYKCDLRKELSKLNK